MKNRIRVFVLALFLISTITYAESQPIVKASSAILINAETGETLYSKNSTSIMAPASTTKIMTAIIAIEKGDLDQKIRISRRAAGIPGSSMYLRSGEIQTLRNLLYGLLLSSGNDAASAIAEHIAGTESKFAKMMTAKALELGMKNTCFKNASGLPATGHHTTAHDMALLAQYALKNPVFAEIVQTKTASVTSSRSNRSRFLKNHNKLLWQYPYVTGIKTGYTRKAGRCLVASASQNGVTLISVVLKSGTMYNDTVNLFSYGFQSLEVRDDNNSKDNNNLENQNGPVQTEIQAKTVVQPELLQPEGE